MFDYLWIPITLIAATFQVTRLGLQKNLKDKLSPVANAFARFGFGLPLAFGYFVLQAFVHKAVPDVHLTFFLYILLGSVSQIIGTILIVMVFSHRNFAVGVAYSKTEIFFVAILGSLLFGEHLSDLGILAIIIGTVAVVTIMAAKYHLAPEKLLDKIFSRQSLLGMGAGLGFAFTAIGARHAILSLEGTPMLLNSALALAAFLTVETVLIGGYLLWREPKQFQKMRQNLKMVNWVGWTSTLGSIAWFIAFALQLPAYVKTLSQVEMVFSLLLTHYLFKERILRREVLGMVLVAVSVVLLVLGT